MKTFFKKLARNIQSLFDSVSDFIERKNNDRICRRADEDRYYKNLDYQGKIEYHRERARDAEHKFKMITVLIGLILAYVSAIVLLNIL